MTLHLLTVAVLLGAAVLVAAKVVRLPIRKCRWCGVRVSPSGLFDHFNEVHRDNRAFDPTTSRREAYFEEFSS